MLAVREYTIDEPGIPSWRGNLNSATPASRQAAKDRRIILSYETIAPKTRLKFGGTRPKMCSCKSGTEFPGRLVPRLGTAWRPRRLLRVQATPSRRYDFIRR